MKLYSVIYSTDICDGKVVTEKPMEPTEKKMKILDEDTEMQEQGTVDVDDFIELFEYGHVVVSLLPQ